MACFSAKPNCVVCRGLLLIWPALNDISSPACPNRGGALGWNFLFSQGSGAAPAGWLPCGRRSWVFQARLATSLSVLGWLPASPGLGLPAARWRR